MVFRNIQITDGRFPYSIFYGSDAAHQVKHVTIENLTVHGKKITSLADAKCYLENAADIRIR